MKRFCCALIILVLTISCAVLLNGKIIKSADEITQKINEKESKEISELWNDDKLIFSLLLTQEKTEKINTLIKEIEQKNAPSDELRELKNYMAEIKDSFRIKIENIL